MNKKEKFDYPIAYGCWLNDSRENPITDEDWPSIRIDENTIDSLTKTMRFLRDAGYEYFDVFGLITNNNWTNNIFSTVNKTRENLIKNVIDIIHKNGLKLIYGLGVYSWGFEDIIEQNPLVKGTSSMVMCASSTQSQHTMEKVIDYIATTYEIDGFHLEAADQGRCECAKCSTYDDIEYFNRINILVAQYIRKNHPNKILLVNTSGYLPWGDRFSHKQLQQLIPLGKVIDVFIDVASHGEFVALKDRKGFIEKFSPSFGTANGFWIYPPQRWDRLRWFIPHIQHNISHLSKLYEDGGRSCELYLAPLINPGVELTILCNGLYIHNPTQNVSSILKSAVKKLYSPRTEKDCESICKVFTDAENLFFNSYTPIRNRTIGKEYSDGVEHIFNWSKTRKNHAQPGELFLERLFGIEPGYPCYLSLHFDHKGRKKYIDGMKKLLEDVRFLLSLYPQHSRLERIEKSITLVIKDIELVMKDFDS